MIGERVITTNPRRNHVPSTMIASSEQCRRHVSGAAGAVSSFSDDGVVQSVLKELKGVGEDQRSGTKPPLVSQYMLHRIRASTFMKSRLGRRVGLLTRRDGPLIEG